VLKVLTHVEYSAVSGVFQNIDPHPPSTQSECVLPPTKGGGYTLGGFNINRMMGIKRRKLDF